MAGAEFGRYRLLAELGSGGMAVVYLAASSGPSGFTKLAVLKVLRRELADDPTLLARFLDEARLAARLDHPNVVQTNEVGEFGGRHAIVMEYLEGQALSALLEKGARQGPAAPLGVRLRVIADALAGLHHAHELADFDGTPLDIVHRDVSPQNVFVTYQGQTKVLDFGIAKIAGASQRTETGVVMGKIRHMAPEQFLGERVDRRADVFAVGTMLWEAATGVRLWAGMSDAEVMNRIVHGAFPSPAEANPAVPEPLAALCLKALAFSPDDRHATCLELQTEIERVAAEIGASASSRDVAATMAELFDGAKSTRRAAVNEQLAKLARSEEPDGPAVGDGLGNESLSLPRFGSRSGRSATLAGGATNVSPGEAHALGTSTLASAVPRRTRAWRAAPVIALLAASSTLLRWWPSSAAPPGPPPASPAAPLQSASVASAAPPPEAEATLAISVLPREALVFVDDAPFALNPGAKRLRRDGAVHVVRAEAPGYLAHVEFATLDGDRDVVVQLERRPGGRAEPGPKAAPTPAKVAPTLAKLASTPAKAAPAAPPPAASAHPGPKAPRPIDRRSPWTL